MIKVLTFNIRTALAISDGRNMWPLRRKSALEVIKSSRADLIGLQEVRPMQLAYLRSKLGQYQVISAGRNNGRSNGRARGEHCTVLVNRDRFEVSEWKVRWFSPTPDVPGSRYEKATHPRIATYVRLIDKSSGIEFMFVNLHLDHALEVARNNSALNLVSSFKESALPWILVGDFNCNIDDQSLQPLWEAGFADTLAPLPARGPNTATHHRFSGATDGDRIDHIFVTPQISVVEAHIDFTRPFGRLPSDHWPVAAQLLIREGSNNG